MDHNNLLELSIIASIEAGARIMEVYETPFDIELKKDNSPLTLADQESNRIITDHLKSTDFPILSEEGKLISYNERSKWPVFWMVDPLDGTKEFIKKNGEFTVNIALIENGVSIMGVVYAPALDILYFGSRELGSYSLQEATSKVKALSNESSIIDSLLTICNTLPDVKKERPYTAVASRSHLSPETEQFIHKLKAQHGEINFISSGSSLKICLVAEGTADVYPRLAPTMEWDTSAGQAVANFAGCSCNQYENDEPMHYNKKDLLNPFFVVARN